VDELGRTLDVGHHERDLAARQGPFRSKLRPDEAERYDPVLPRRPEQSHPGSIAAGLVLEVDPIEPGERVPDVRLVVDRQAPSAVRVDVGERAVRQLRPRSSIECRHRPQSSRLGPTGVGPGSARPPRLSLSVDVR
jgi:hypothetical protein